jgi:hypothetical protein
MVKIKSSSWEAKIRSKDEGMETGSNNEASSTI